MPEVPAEPESFIKTPLEFFGHSYDEIHFGYPQQYHDALQEAQAAADAEITGVEERRARFLAGDPEALKDRYVSTQQEYELSLSYAKRHHTQDVNHTWYERRFRGRYASNVDFSQFPQVEQFISAINKRQWESDPEKHPLPDPLPSASEFAGYFNEAIRLNEWSSVHWEAMAWYEVLPEDSPDRETAKNYVAFAGNIVLQEYCRIAVSLACDELADDDFVSVKHLLTVCWPMAMRLEPFIPDEVKRSKQLLRETFLQMAARGSSNFRSHIELFGWATLGQDRSAGLDERDALEKQAYTALMAFDDTESQDKAAIKQELLSRAEKLAAAQRWDAAIDVLELSTHAYGLPLDELQAVIDRYAVDGALYFTSDMSKMNEMWQEKIGRHEYWTCNTYKVDELRRAPGISEEAYQKITEIEDIRGFEYEVQQLTGSGEEEKQVLIAKLFDKLANTDAGIARRFATPEIVEGLMDFLMHESIGKLSPQHIDEVIVSVVSLCNKDVLSREQQNSALLSMGEQVLARAKDPEDYETFTRFIGFVSPILRMTKVADKPEDEVIWKYITPTQFDSFMKNLRGHAYDRSQSGESHADSRWLQDQHFAFGKDIRKAWKAYWDEREEY